jgi:apolipoprotein N-acyltransferase
LEHQVPKLLLQRVFCPEVLLLLMGGLLAYNFNGNESYPMLLIPMFAIGFAYLLLTMLDATPRTGFIRGLLFGLGFFAVGASWVYVSIHEFGYTSISLASILTGLFVLILALFPAAAMWTLCRLFPRSHATYRILAFPIIWVLFEVFRSTAFTGFPWLLVAFSQTNTLLGAYAPVLGEVGLGFLTLCLSSFLVALFALNSKRARALSLLGLILIPSVALALQHITWTHPDATLTTSLVQGNIPQSSKWDGDMVANHLDTHLELTAPLLDSQLIVWSENAVPALPDQIPNFLKMLEKTTKQHHNTLLAGIPVRSDDGAHYYNGIIAINQHTQFYFKRHLVPFGEYVPLAGLLRGLIGFFDLPMSDFVPGAMNQPLITANNIPLATLICYEIAYSELVRTSLPQAQLLVTVSDDAWFGDSKAPVQHLQIAQFRALQSGRPALFATNNGVTAMIDYQGHVLKELPQFVKGTLTSTVTTRTGSTPWSRMGDWPVIGVLGLLLAGLLLWSRKTARS